MDPKILIVTVLSLTSMCFWGCGYGFQNSRNPLRDKEGVHKVFVEPMVNNTYKPGVENVVYNNIIKTLSVHGRVTLVQTKADADAILQGAVNVASSSVATPSRVENLKPNGVGGGLLTRESNIAAVYIANLSCSFSLKRVVPTDPPVLVSAGPHSEHPKGSQKLQEFQGRKKRDLLWASSFVRSKPYPGANQLDVPGTTSALINSSEFDRAIADLAKSMMDDMHESMLAMF